MDSDLFSRQHYPPIEHLGPVKKRSRGNVYKLASQDIKRQMHNYLSLSKIFTGKCVKLLQLYFTLIFCNDVAWNTSVKNLKSLENYVKNLF